MNYIDFPYRSAIFARIGMLKPQSWIFYVPKKGCEKSPVLRRVCRELDSPKQRAACNPTIRFKDAHCTFFLLYYNKTSATARDDQPLTITLFCMVRNRTHNPIMDYVLCSSYAFENKAHWSVMSFSSPSPCHEPTRFLSAIASTFLPVLGHRFRSYPI